MCSARSAWSASSTRGCGPGPPGGRTGAGDGDARRAAQSSRRGAPDPGSNPGRGLGGALGLLADRIFADADHPDQAARQVAGLLRLGQLHGTEALQAAATVAMSANVRSYRFVQHLLAKGRIDALEDPAGGVGPHANLRGPAYYH